MITPIDSTPFVIGRMADCDIQTLENQISKRHCAIVFRKKNQKYYLKDLGSQNGTFLNGHYIENAVPVELKDQDVIQVGKSRYRFSARNET